MIEKILVLLIAALLSTSFDLAHAQSPSSVPRIGFLHSGDASTRSVEALRKGLGQLGYVDGRDSLIEPRYAEGRPDRLQQMADELVRLKVDVIVTTATEASVSAQRATSTIPIVMGGGGDPVAAGLVASVARPGGNVTGVASVSGVPYGIFSGGPLDRRPVCRAYGKPEAGLDTPSIRRASTNVSRRWRASMAHGFSRQARYFRRSCPIR